MCKESVQDEYIIVWILYQHKELLSCRYQCFPAVVSVPTDDGKKRVLPFFIHGLAIVSGDTDNGDTLLADNGDTLLADNGEISLYYVSVLVLYNVAINLF